MTDKEKARAYDEALERARKQEYDYQKELNKIDKNSQLAGLLRAGISALEMVFPELAESEDERIRKEIIDYLHLVGKGDGDYAQPMINRWIAYLEKQKENPKSADSISADCVSDAKCEDRWHKVGDSLPDNGRLVLANDCLGNTLLARYDGEGNWEVSVYDNEDYYCRNTITKWCEIPSEKQKEQKPILEVFGFKVGDAVRLKDGDGRKHIIKSFEEVEGLHGPNFYHVEFEDDSARDGIYPGEEYPNGYYTQMEKFEEEQKQEWSEEDERMRVNILNALTPNLVYSYGKGTSTGTSMYKYDKEIKWLKSLRPSWKPSEEQVLCLDMVLTSEAMDDNVHTVLAGLQEQLKRIKED